MSTFNFPYTLAWGFIAHAYKTGSWLPIFTANELVRPTPVIAICAKFGADWTNRFKVIQLLVKFVVSLAAILDFEKFYFGANRHTRGGKLKLRLKFHENRTYGSEVIQVFVN